MSTPTRRSLPDFSNLRLTEVPTQDNIQAAKKLRRRNRFLLLRDDSCDCLYPKIDTIIPPSELFPRVADELSPRNTHSIKEDNPQINSILEEQRGEPLNLEALGNAPDFPMPQLDRCEGGSVGTTSTSASSMSSASGEYESNELDTIVKHQSLRPHQLRTRRFTLEKQDSLTSINSNDLFQHNTQTITINELPSGVADDIDIEEQRRLLDHFNNSCSSRTDSSITSTASSRSMLLRTGRASVRKTLAEMEEEQFRKLGCNQQRSRQNTFGPGV